MRVVLLFAAASVVSCDQRPAIFTDTERRHADSVVSTARGVDGLRRLQQRLYATGDRLGSIVALRELGRELRNESRFEEALCVHSEGLRQAETVADTTEWIQALNNIGTDYRRMGILDVAQEYHYNAWQLSEAHADTTFSAQKNLVMSLNGLGNVYLTMGNYPRADSMFRLALRGERLLRSTVGQAINYANLGAIFEHRGSSTPHGPIIACRCSTTARPAAPWASHFATPIMAHSMRNRGNMARSRLNMRQPIG